MTLIAFVVQAEVFQALRQQLKNPYAYQALTDRGIDNLSLESPRSYAVIQASPEHPVGTMVSFSA